jgi:N-acetylglucosamine-6-phosphate deacetylase
MTTLFQNARKVDARGQIDEFWMVVADGIITKTGTGLPPRADETIDLGGSWLVPGFIDLHGHGGGGHSYDDAAIDAEEHIRGAVAVHRRHGTTRSVLSLVVNPVESLDHSLGVIARLAASDPLILGTHLEGPFLARERRGAHNEKFLSKPSPDVVARLLDAAQGTLVQMTLAPELPGALDAITQLTDAGVRVAVGHSTANYKQSKEAFDRGATILTHVFNGMAAIHHRDPGPVIAAFDDLRVTIELVLDGVHVDPSVARMSFLAAAGRIALVTDAMAAAGFHDGDYSLGSLNVAVRDGLAMLRGTTTIAGSTLTQDVALRCAIEKSGVSPQSAIEALTLTPAKAIGLGDSHGLLAEGYAADAVALSDSWHVERVWAAGDEIV